MEIQHKQPHTIVAEIVNSNNIFMQFTFIQFLSCDIIMNFALKAQQFKYPQYFFKLALTVAFFKNYVNRIDRSMYYVFYDEQEYKALEKKFISHFAQNHIQKIIESQHRYQNIFLKLNSQIQILSDQEEFNSIIQNTFFQTDFPLPQCKRQTIGVYCQSPFQQFLALQRFPVIGGDQFTEPPLDELKEKVTEQMENTVIYVKQNSQQLMSKMCLIRFCGYEIKNVNWENLIIENFLAHNVIVLLLSLTSMNAKMSAILIEQQQDPIMKLSEFITRANIYTNIVLAVEEKFGFLFQYYGEIFQLLYKNAIKLPKFSFWNSAMTIWVQETQVYQQEIQQNFCYVSLKLREEHLLTVLQSQSQRFPSIYNGVKLQYEQKMLCQTKRNQVYQNVQGAVSYQAFFQKNIDSYEVLAKDYLEHTQDISINQITVHRCDHSDHQIIKSPYFQCFAKKIIQSSIEFYNNIQRVVFKKLSDKQLRLSILKDLIKQDLNFIDGKFVKPVILKQIFNSAQEIINSSVNKMKEFNVFEEEGVEKFSLKFDFSHKDNLLDYFASKAQIPVNVTASMASFYNTYKQKTPQILIEQAMNDHKDDQSIQSQIDDQAYDSSLSNSSFMSNEE